jgi:hypothetical protein
MAAHHRAGRASGARLVAFDQALAVTRTAQAGMAVRQTISDVTANRLYVGNRGANGLAGFSGAGVTMFDAGTLEPLATWSTGAGIAFAALAPAWYACRTGAAACSS